MRIGIDLDNTILDYRGLFHETALEKGWINEHCPDTKEGVKAGLKLLARNAEEAEYRWQKLQARVYGPLIHKAKVYEGFRDFILLARERNIPVLIISHKTETSNVDRRVKFRTAATQTLARRRFFKPIHANGYGFSPEDITYCDRQFDKIWTISEKKVTLFIDDLEAVFRNGAWTRDVSAVLIHTKPTNRRLYAMNWHAMCGILLFQLLMRKLPHRCTPIKQGGNNRIFSLTRKGGPHLAYKHFAGDIKIAGPRIEREYAFLQMLLQARLGDYISEPFDKGGKGILMALMGGKTPVDLDADYVGKMTTFLNDLYKVRIKIEPSALPNAAHARFRPIDFVTQIGERLQQLVDACERGDTPEQRKVLEFLKGPFARRHARAITHFYQVLEDANISPESELPQNRRLPSPSDFGLHNMLVQGVHVAYCDFEYAGWDDPAKLICDIFYHVGSGLTQASRKALIEALFLEWHWDRTLRKRVEACHQLVRLEWVLIVLNVVRPEEMERKLFANPDKTPRVLAYERLQKAQEMLYIKKAHAGGNP